jgi:hypothetical protein
MTGTPIAHMQQRAVLALFWLWTAFGCNTYLTLAQLMAHIFAIAVSNGLIRPSTRRSSPTRPRTSSCSDPTSAATPTRSTSSSTTRTPRRASKRRSTSSLLPLPASSRPRSCTRSSCILTTPTSFSRMQRVRPSWRWRFIPSSSDLSRSRPLGPLHLQARETKDEDKTVSGSISTETELESMLLRMTDDMREPRSSRNQPQPRNGPSRAPPTGSSPCHSMQSGSSPSLFQQSGSNPSHFLQLPSLLPDGHRNCSKRHHDGIPNPRTSRTTSSLICECPVCAYVGILLTSFQLLRRTSCCQS